MLKFGERGKGRGRGRGRGRRGREEKGVREVGQLQ
jgi:hypothetical protein